MRLLQTLLVSSALAVGQAGHVGPAETAGKPAGSSTFRHFLFIRRNADAPPRSDMRTSTLVMATVRPDGFDLRDVWTNRRLSNAELLCVLNGKVYLYLSGDLLCLDIEGGRCSSIRQDVRSYSYSHVDGWVFCVDGGRLHGFDLRREVSRPIAVFGGGFDGRFAASPDGTRIASFGWAGQGLAGSYRLSIVRVEDGKCTDFLETHDFVTSDRSSSIGGKPCPFAWLDDHRILFVKSVPAEEDAAAAEPVRFPNQAVHWAAVADVATGTTRQVAVLPGAANSTRVTVRPARSGVPALIDLSHRGRTHYSVDLRHNKLVERDELPAGLSLRGGGVGTKDLRHGTKLLGQTDSRAPYMAYMAVSPDLRQVVWVGPRTRGLHYCNMDRGGVRTVGEERYARGLLWFTDQVLTPRVQSGPPPDGWRPFEHSEYPRERPPDPRPPITDYLSLTLSCDKQVYAQHEPVQLTVTLVNKSDLEFQAVRPCIDGRFCQLAMDFPGGSTLISPYWGPPEIRPVNPVALKPNGELTSTVAVETRRPGKYCLKAQLKTRANGFKAPLNLRGRLQAEPVEFRVERADNEDQLLNTKMNRLLDTLRAQHAEAPDWDGSLLAVDDLTDVGPVATPYLLAALREEAPALVRTRLVWVLNKTATPEALPFYKELLASDDATMQKLAVEGLCSLWRRKPTAEAADFALDVLVEALLAGRTSVLRRETAKQLARLRSSEVRNAFEEAVTSGEEAVVKVAGPYLIAWEETPLADWLAVAAREPTRARLASAGIVIGDLRQEMHAEAMPHLGELTWKLVSKDAEHRAQLQKALRAWEAWARENPGASEGYLDSVRKSWRER